jgi:hypothetical protein
MYNFLVMKRVVACQRGAEIRRRNLEVRVWVTLYVTTIVSEGYVSVVRSSTCL